MDLSPHLGFWGCGFESTSLFWGGCGFESTSLFWGVGEFVLNFVLFGCLWWFYFDFLGDYFFKGNFFFFVFVLWWNFI